MSNKYIKIALACFTGLPYLLRLWLVTRPLELVAVRQPLLEDDFFYYLNIARNIARGNGFTADGITPTNGFQPVHEWLCAAVTMALPSSPLTVMHAILVVQVAVSAAAAFVLYDLLRAMHGRNTAAVGVLAFSWWLPLFRYGNNGLETVLQLLALLLVLRSLVEWVAHTEAERGSAKKAWRTGAIVGLAILVRIDMAILGAALAAWSAGVAMMSAPERRTRFLALAAAAAVCTGGTLGLGLLMNHAINGRWLHDSGVAVRSLADLYSAQTGRETGALQLLGESFSRSLFDLAPAQLLTVMGIPVLIARIVLLLIVAAALISAVRAKGRDEALIPLLLYCAMLWITYALGIRAYWFMGRYLLPMTVIVSFVVVLPAAVNAAAAVTRSWNPRVTALAGIALFAAYCAAPAMRWSSFVFESAAEPHAISNFDIARWVDSSLTRESRIATWQGGLISFMTGRNIIQLDGVVNRDALEAREHHRLGEYLQSRKIEYVVDFRLMTEYLTAELSRYGMCELTPYDSLISPDHNTDVLMRKVVYKR